MPELLLHGCTSQPLLSYLKALGVLKLVAQQADPGARGAWRGTAFALSSRLSREDLLAFFLEAYEPSPIFSPWNKDGGFLKPGAFQDVLRSSAPRWSRVRRGLEAGRRVHDALLPEGLPVKDRKKLLEQKKDELRLRLAAELDEDAVEWLETCFVRIEEAWRPFFLLGSGGNDGRLDFSSTYLGHLTGLLPASGDPPSRQASAALRDALFAEGEGARSGSKVGQFHPSGAGGPNMATGFGGEESSLVNPWDYVLGLEGALVVRGGTSRRLDPAARGAAAFPFTFQSVSGLGAEIVDGEDVRVELWLPLWGRPARLAEIRALFAEARARVGRRLAGNSLDMARAAVSRGVDRGIGTFQRFEIAQRNGKNYLAVPAGLFRVRDAAGESELLRDVESWMEGWRRATRDSDKVPAAYARARRAIDRGAFELCLHGGRERVCALLSVLGRAQAVLGQGARFRQEKFLKPLTRLRADWVRRADDGSPELALALALARIGAGKRPSPPDERGARSLREELEPVARKNRSGYAWREGETDGGLFQGRLEDRLVDLLSRRLRAADSDGASTEARIPAPLHAVAAFLGGEIDETKLAGLAHALLALETRAVRADRRATTPEELRALPRAYALLKLVFHPGGLRRRGFDAPVRVRPEAAVLALLRAVRVEEAVVLAARRLRAHGLVPLSIAPALDHPDPVRLAAALLFPISALDAARLASLVLVPESDVETEVEADAPGQSIPVPASGGERTP